jgi:ubiquinone biosynthesis protein
LFVFGFFQGDPHPGNILIRRDNTIAFVDFGIFGELTTSQRENFAGFFENIALGNIEQSFRYYARQHTPTADTDLRAFERDGRAVLYRWYQTSINPFTSAAERHMARHAIRMIEVVRRHRLRTDPNAVLLWRALYALDSSSERLSAYFDTMAQIRAFFIQLRPGPLERIATTLGDRSLSLSLARLGRDAPVCAEGLLSDLIRGEFQVLPVTDESTSLRRARNHRLKLLAQIMVGASIATMALAVPVGNNYRLVFLALATIAFAVLLVQTRTP